MDEGRNKIDVTELVDDTNIDNEDFSLDNNIDLLFERAVNTLTN
ncbi:4631_t:CDS:1, partial [Funneliformis geosporum]